VSNPSLAKKSKRFRELAEAKAALGEAVGLLREAVEDIEDWGGYASQYFQDKHDLRGCIATYRDWLAKNAGGT
jgi:hypothetical protein